MSLPAQEAYDHLASVYDRRWAFYTEATLGATLEELELRQGDRVLDLAAGTGELAPRLLQRQDGLVLVGLDLSRPMLMQGLGKSSSRAWGPVRGDAARLPFGTGRFDAVLCTNAFHHFIRPSTVLAEIRRVLRPGGALTLVDWCDDYLTCKLCSLYLTLTDPSFRRAYSLSECRCLLEAAGFRVIASRKFKINWLWGLMRLDARAEAVCVDDVRC
jgi:ubiquinone/menaquinone biosynthesis C-methylase UbiE